jgi:hypothetical protein
VPPPSTSPISPSLYLHGRDQQTPTGCTAHEKGPGSREAMKHCNDDDNGGGEEENNEEENNEEENNEGRGTNDNSVSSFVPLVCVLFIFLLIITNYYLQIGYAHQKPQQHNHERKPKTRTQQTQTGRERVGDKGNGRMTRTMGLIQSILYEIGHDIDSLIVNALI